MCTNYEYMPYGNYSDNIKSRLTSYLKSIFPMETNLEATLDILVNIISGTKSFVQCVLCGIGCNGKTCFIYLLKKMLGDYFRFTGSAGLVGSSENSKYRLLKIEYQEIPIPNNSTNIIMETNMFSCDSQVKIIPFMSKFVDKSVGDFDYLNSKNLPRNTNIKSELEELAPVFMSMLINRFLSKSIL